MLNELPAHVEGLLNQVKVPATQSESSGVEPIRATQ